jgi:hypothetical protein
LHQVEVSFGTVASFFCLNAQLRAPPILPIVKGGSDAAASIARSSMPRSFSALCLDVAQRCASQLEGHVYYPGPGLRQNQDTAEAHEGPRLRYASVRRSMTSRLGVTSSFFQHTVAIVISVYVSGTRLPELSDLKELCDESIGTFQLELHPALALRTLAHITFRAV